MKSKTTLEMSAQPCGAGDWATVYSILQVGAQRVQERGLTHWVGLHTESGVKKEIGQSVVFILRNSEKKEVGTVTVSQLPPAHFVEEDSNFWTEPDAPAMYLRSLAVVPEYRGTRSAKTLLLAAQRAAEEQGAHFLRLDTNSQYQQLLSFCKRWGCVVKGSRNGRTFLEKAI